MTDSNQQRVLRWVFVRGGDRQTCEVALNERALLYEFSIAREGRPASVSIDRFPDASQAFERQCRHEAALINEGWTLHAYESRDIELATT
jgi:hypothetical protein